MCGVRHVTQIVSHNAARLPPVQGFNKTASSYISLLSGSGLDERLVVELAPAGVIRA